MITKELTERVSVTVICCNDGWLDGVEIGLECATGELSGGKWGSDPSSDTEIKDSVASEIGTRGSGLLIRGLVGVTPRVVVKMPVREEMEGDARDDAVAVLGGIGPGGRSGGGETAEDRDEKTEEGLRKDVSKVAWTSSSSS